MDKGTNNFTTKNIKNSTVTFNYKSSDDAILALKKAYSQIYDDVTDLTYDEEDGSLTIYHSTNKYDHSAGYDGSNNIEDIELEEAPNNGVDVIIRVKDTWGKDINLKVQVVNVLIKLGDNPIIETKPTEGTTTSMPEHSKVTQPLIVNVEGDRDDELTSPFYNKHTKYHC